jgi:hypothetical protein
MPLSNAIKESLGIITSRKGYEEYERNSEDE